MAPKKRTASLDSESSTRQTKRVSKSEVERLICKKRLDKLDQEESQIKEDRFTSVERRILLEAYNIHGFQVFQDTKLLHKHLPNRRESDLKGLIQRLRTNFGSHVTEGESKQSTLLEDWQKLCQQCMGNFAKDRKINLDDVLADALIAVADKKDEELSSDSAEPNEIRPNYPVLLKSFAQLLMGRFPENLGPLEAQISMKLYQHINEVVESSDLTALAPLEDGKWLESSIEQRRKRQEMALRGLDGIDGKTKKSPTLRDIERNRDMEALCLELPKIKRITDVLNPLFINESLLSTLMDSSLMHHPPNTLR